MPGATRLHNLGDHRLPAQAQQFLSGREFTAQEIQDIQETVRVYWRSYSETPAARRASFHSPSILNSKIHFSR